MILLLLSLLLLCGCLVGLVKLLNSMLGARVKTIISDHVNKVRSCSVMHWILIITRHHAQDIPVRGLGWLTGYLAMVVGAGLTVLVQSSSVFTSTLTPLAGTGLVTLDRVYPLTLGSNIGMVMTDCCFIHIVLSSQARQPPACWQPWPRPGTRGRRCRSRWSTSCSTSRASSSSTPCRC